MSTLTATLVGIGVGTAIYVVFLLLILPWFERKISDTGKGKGKKR